MTPRIVLVIGALAVLGGIGLVMAWEGSRSTGAPGAFTAASGAGSAPGGTPAGSPSGSIASLPAPSLSATRKATPATTSTRPAGTGAAPVPASWPNAATTGVPAGRKLTSSGAIRVTQPGTVIDGLDVHGDISVEANNVTIKNSRIVTAGTWAIIQRDNVSGLTVQDCDIYGNGKDQLQFAVFNLGGMVTILRNEMSVVSDAISTSVGLIADNYLHDPKFFPGDHIDMIQSDAGPGPGQRLVIRHNTIINTYDQTSAIALFQDFGVQHDASIENNLLAGGGYALYGGAGSKGKSSNIQVVNNVFSRQVFPNSGNFGPVAYWDEDGAGNVWQSNVWADTGSAVTP
jgi:hypothetical protein